MTALPPSGTVLCELSDLDATGAREFSFGERMERIGVFVVREKDEVYGYINSCPHIGVPLNLEADEFISDLGHDIICSTHGARFRISDGFCLSGPCEGDALEPVAVILQDGKVLLA
ncbi:MAG: Rieske (2Fe-2S) protein [Pseudomonadota bacterium]